MSDEIDEGGPAFPVGSDTTGGQGMSLRDYFAAVALQGMLTQGFIPAEVTRNKDDWSYTLAAYRLADNMLKARARNA